MNAVSIVSPLRLCSAWYLDDQHTDDGLLSFRSSRPAGLNAVRDNSGQPYVCCILTALIFPPIPSP